MSTFREWCEQHSISCASRQVASRPDALEWSPCASHWRVTLRNRKLRKQLTVWYSMGSAHRDAPDAADVLSCLVLDCESGGEDFASFCQTYGYDEDSRRAERIWKACKEMARKLPRFLGADYQAARQAAQEH